MGMRIQSQTKREIKNLRSNELSLNNLLLTQILKKKKQITRLKLKNSPFLKIKRTGNLNMKLLMELREKVKKKWQMSFILRKRLEKRESLHIRHLAMSKKKRKSLKNQSLM